MDLGQPQIFHCYTHTHTRTHIRVAFTDQPVFGMDVLGQEDPVREATVHQRLDALDPLCITWHVHLTSQLQQKQFTPFLILLVLSLLPYTKETNTLEKGNVISCSAAEIILSIFLVKTLLFLEPPMKR